MKTDPIAAARKVLIALFALTNLMFGAYCLVNPTALAEVAGLGAPSPEVLAELRAVYGGLVGSLGIVVLLSLSIANGRNWQLVASILFAGLVLGRSVGAWIDGPVTFTLWALAFEGAAAGVLIWHCTSTPAETGRPVPALGESGAQPRPVD